MAREQQRMRTRKDLLRAAGRLLGEGRSPSFDEIADAAMVSRATAYRYFPGLDALLVEAALDMIAPEADVLDTAAPDLASRLVAVDDAFDRMTRGNEPALRTMLVHALQRRLRGEDELPVRQNRRMPLIQAAIGAAETQPAAPAADRLAKAVALLVGTEAMIAAKDVLQLADDDARAVRHWAIRALAAAALKETDDAGA